MTTETTYTIDEIQTAFRMSMGVHSGWFLMEKQLVKLKKKPKTPMRFDVGQYMASCLVYLDSCCDSDVCSHLESIPLKDYFDELAAYDECLCNGRGYKNSKLYGCIHDKYDQQRSIYFDGSWDVEYLKRKLDSMFDEYFKSSSYESKTKSRITHLQKMCDKKYVSYQIHKGQ